MPYTYFGSFSSHRESCHYIEYAHFEKRCLLKQLQYIKPRCDTHTRYFQLNGWVDTLHNFSQKSYDTLNVTTIVEFTLPCSPGLYGKLGTV